jgi:hypothetical protein
MPVGVKTALADRQSAAACAGRTRARHVRDPDRRLTRDVCHQPRISLTASAFDAVSSFQIRQAMEDLQKTIIARGMIFG